MLCCSLATEAGADTAGAGVAAGKATVPSVATSAGAAFAACTGSAAGAATVAGPAFLKQLLKSKSQRG